MVRLDQYIPVYNILQEIFECGYYHALLFQLDQLFSPDHFLILSEQILLNLIFSVN